MHLEEDEEDREDAIFVGNKEVRLIHDDNWWGWYTLIVTENFDETKSNYYPTDVSFPKDLLEIDEKTSPEVIPLTKPEIQPDPEPVVEPVPKIIESEKKDSNDDLAAILPYLGIVIAVIIVGAVTMKIRSSRKDDEFSEDYKDDGKDSVIEDAPLTKKFQDMQTKYEEYKKIRITDSDDESDWKGI